MPEAPQENTSQESSIFSPLPQSSPTTGSPGETPEVKSSPSKNSKKTLMVGAVLVVLMLVLVGVTFYTLRSGSSSTSPSPAPASVSPTSDQGLDQSVNQVNADFSNIEKDLNSADGGLNDKAADLTY